MILKRINLFNFRQFKDVNIEFSQDPQKNITVILGDNTTGKTTLIRAFIWCLYGINLFKKNKCVLNHDVQMEMKPGEVKKASVSLNLEHEGLQYKITATEEFRKGSDSVVSSRSSNRPTIKIIKGKGDFKPVAEEQIRPTIRNILPEELKGYFFFDGEDNSIESITDRSNLTEAVSNLLGLKKVENLINLFSPSKSDSVYANLRKDLITDKNEIGASIHLDKISNIQGEINDQEIEIEKYQQSIQGLDSEIAGLDREIEANKDAAEYQRQRLENQRKLKDLQDDAQNRFAEITKFLSEGDAFLDILFHASYSHYQLDKVLDSSHFTPNDSYHDISGKAVDELVKRGRCLCGAVITNGNDAYRHLMDAKQHMEPIDFGGYAENFKKSERVSGNFSAGDFKRLDDQLFAVQDDSNGIANCEEEIKDLSDKLAGRKDVGKLEDNRSNKIEVKNRQEGYLEALQNQKEEKKEELRRENEELKKATSNDKRNDATRRAMDYCDAICDSAKEYLSIQQAAVRSRLQEEVNNAFEQMYAGKRRVIIGSNFHFSTHLLEASSERIDDSGGLSTVTNFAFVAGLISLAKNKIISSDTPSALDDSSERDENYPLVMDAPFSKTDSTHIRNVCRVIPTYCNQLIMALMEKDFKEGEDVLNQKVGKKYRFNKISETETEIVEEDN